MKSWDSWDDFLKVIASDHELTVDQKAVFLVRFSRQKLDKSAKNQEIADEVIGGDPKNALSAYDKRMGEVFDKLSQSFSEINSDSKKKVERTRTCLEKAYLEQQNKNTSEASLTCATPAIASEPGWRSRFQALIEDKTKDFVGREYVFDKIEDFLSNRDRGYFTIEGDPGMGKSSILAEYVRRGECVAHFNEHLGGINRTSQFLESICTQLIAKYGLPYSELPPDANQDNAFLVKLLQQISDQLKPGERLVIVVDALDEVDIDSQDKSKNILYLPRYLPKNVFFVMTRRRGIDFLFVVDTPKYLFDLMAEEYADESLQDVQTFIRQHVNEHERLRQWINAKQLTVEDFVTQLADKSENNFMYLRCVLVDVEDGIYQDATIESLPQGLEAYYEDHWQRMGMTTEPPPRTKIRIVYILSETPKPIPYDEIVYYIKYTGEPEAELTVQEVLDKWKQFLHKQREYQQIFYRLYHDSFRRFLNRKDIVEKAGIAIKEIKGLMADSIWQDLLGDG
jgi:hypothetical protein